jgi:hypothetical protein
VHWFEQALRSPAQRLPVPASRPLVQLPRLLRALVQLVAVLLAHLLFGVQVCRLVRISLEPLAHLHHQPQLRPLVLGWDVQAQAARARDQVGRRPGVLRHVRVRVGRDGVEVEELGHAAAGGCVEQRQGAEERLHVHQQAQLLHEHVHHECPHLPNRRAAERKKRHRRGAPRRRHAKVRLVQTQKGRDVLPLLTVTPLPATRGFCRAVYGILRGHTRHLKRRLRVTRQVVSSEGQPRS